jgi:hypothetical protein
MNETVTPEMKQTRMKTFMSLLPLVVEIAGLPQATPERLFNADQMEGRILALRTAYRLADAMIREIGETGVPAKPNGPA